MDYKKKKKKNLRNTQSKKHDLRLTLIWARVNCKSSKATKYAVLHVNVNVNVYVIGHSSSGLFRTNVNK